jgi:hypothetical protein
MQSAMIEALESLDNLDYCVDNQSGSFKAISGDHNL